MAGQHQDYSQNFWHLTCIQTASWGLPGLMASVFLKNTFGAGTVILSSLIANLILWLTGFTIVSMAFKEKRNAIENAEAYIGEFGAKLVAIISLFVFPAWYVVQIHVSTVSFSTALNGDHSPHIFLANIYGIILGVIIAFLALGKTIRLIRRLNTFVFPLVVIYYLYGLISSGLISEFPEDFVISWLCITVFISAGFSGMVNLPTFFRHARSKYDCYIALTLITLIYIFFEISSMWISPDFLYGVMFKLPISPSLMQSLMVGIANISISIIFLFCANLVNIYFAYPSGNSCFLKWKNILSIL